MDDLLNQTPPPPMAQFKRESFKRHEDNEKLLTRDAERYKKILTRSDLKRARRALASVQFKIDELGLDALLAQRQTILQEQSEAIEALERLRVRWMNSTEEGKEKIRPKAEHAREAILDTKARLKEINLSLLPYRTLIARRDDIQGRIDEHVTVTLDEAQRLRDSREMMQEANLHAEIIIRTWNRRGLCYEVHRGNKILRRSVKFERIIAMPDEIQFKIAASRKGLIGGTVDLLPNGVSAYKLVEPEMLRELSISCERQIASPNIEGDTDWDSGVWLRLFRLKAPDGIVKKVLWTQVMMRYQADNREKYPFPAGIRAGRSILWINLTDHPHLMVNGQTGAGKTNLLRMILATLVSQHSPDELRFVLVDLKRGGDLNPFAQAPHCVGPVLKSVSEVADVLAQCEKLMSERMETISRVTNDITKYNRIVDPSLRMPRLLIVFDEYTAIHSKGKELASRIEASGIMLATQGRAAGIQLLIGNQQPFSDAVNKQIKANVTVVFGGRQRTQGASMSMFGDASATKIPKIAGRMIVDDGNNTHQIQTPLIEDDDVMRAVAHSVKWGPGRLFELPHIESLDDTQPSEPIVIQGAKREVSEEDVIAVALDHFGGELKATKIHQHLPIGRDRTLAMVKSIIEKGGGEYRGQRFTLQKQVGNFYKLQFTESGLLPEEGLSNIEEAKAWG